MNKNIRTDEIFNELSDALEEAFSTFNDVKSSSTLNRNNASSCLHRNGYTPKENIKVLPTIPASVRDIEYNTRYSWFINNVNNLDYTNYPDELSDGFKAAINQYKKLLDANNKDFKKADNQLYADLKECKKKCEENKDNYLLGYLDGLTLIRRIFNDSKLSSYKKFANKFD